MATQHTLLLKVIEHGDERIPKTLHIIEDDTFLVIADGIGRHNGENLVERTHATRQGHTHVAMGKEQVLAVTERRRGDGDRRTGAASRREAC